MNGHERKKGHDKARDADTLDAWRELAHDLLDHCGQVEKEEGRIVFEPDAPQPDE